MCPDESLTTSCSSTHIQCVWFISDTGLQLCKLCGYLFWLLTPGLDEKSCHLMCGFFSPFTLHHSSPIYKEKMLIALIMTKGFTLGWLSCWIIWNFVMMAEELVIICIINARDLYPDCRYFVRKQEKKEMQTDSIVSALPGILWYLFLFLLCLIVGYDRPNNFF